VAATDMSDYDPLAVFGKAHKANDSREAQITTPTPDINSSQEHHPSLSPSARTSQTPHNNLNNAQFFHTSTHLVQHLVQQGVEPHPDIHDNSSRLELDYWAEEVDPYEHASVDSLTGDAYVHSSPYRTHSSHSFSPFFYNQLHSHSQNTRQLHQYAYSHTHLPDTLREIELELAMLDNPYYPEHFVNSQMYAHLYGVSGGYPNSIPHHPQSGKHFGDHQRYPSAPSNEAQERTTSGQKNTLKEGALVTASEAEDLTNTLMDDEAKRKERSDIPEGVPVSILLHHPTDEKLPSFFNCNEKELPPFHSHFQPLGKSHVLRNRLHRRQMPDPYCVGDIPPYGLVPEIPSFVSLKVTDASQ
jgi:hypothetical protein